MSLYEFADKIEKATLSVSTHILDLWASADIRPSPRASTLPEISEEKPVLRSTPMPSYPDFKLSVWMERKVRRDVVSTRCIYDTLDHLTILVNRAARLYPLLQIMATKFIVVGLGLRDGLA